MKYNMDQEELLVDVKLLEIVALDLSALGVFDIISQLSIWTLANNTPEERIKFLDALQSIVDIEKEKINSPISLSDELDYMNSVLEKKDGNT